MMSAGVHIAEWHIHASLGAILALGFGRLLRRRWRTFGAYTFTDSFHEKFITYCASQGRDPAAYDWLIRHSNRMQRDMGTYGIYGSYKPPYANFAYSYYPIILNMLPDLRRSIERDSGGTLHGEIINNIMCGIDEALLRYIGVLEQRLTRHRNDLLNPFLWLREGTGFIRAAPFLLLSWFGILGAATIERIQISYLFKLLSTLGGSLGLIASAMTVMLGWDETVQLLMRFASSS